MARSRPTEIFRALTWTQITTRGASGLSPERVALGRPFLDGEGIGGEFCSGLGRTPATQVRVVSLLLAAGCDAGRKSCDGLPTVDAIESPGLRSQCPASEVPAWDEPRVDDAVAAN